MPRFATLGMEALAPQKAYDNAPKRALTTLSKMFVLYVENEMMSRFMK
jgi:hypothetical protein